MKTKPQVIAIAGATGFVGQALAQALSQRHSVIGLSRNARTQQRGPFRSWRSCDLFSALDAERALSGVTTAYYLVHSMMPSARLTQGHFSDLDLICADNFARAARIAGVRQIIYLGGLVPESEELSSHLRSRLEVEETLGSHGVPVTSLRAGLILGPGGSSFEILLRLVRRLPAMACPRWTQTRTQPIALEDVVALLEFALGREACFGRSFDIGSPEVTTYRELMAVCGELMGLQRPTLTVPLVTPRLSRLWVSLVTGAPRELVEPLIASLRHEMLVKDHELQRMADRPGLPVRAALSRALCAREAGESPLAFRGARRGPSAAPHVRSVQRMTLPKGRDAKWAAGLYMRWLPRFLKGLLRVETVGSECHFRLRPFHRDLLVLSHAPHRSSPERQLFYITGGVLSGGDRGRFELRQVLGGRTLLAAIHDYQPRLPWRVYATTQAPFHRWVMGAFRRHLRRSAARAR